MHFSTQHVVAITALTLLVNCENPNPATAAEQKDTPVSPSTSRNGIQEVRFTTEDEVTLSGSLYGEGKTAVILAHMGTAGSDRHTWHTFAQVIAKRGFTALAFDFRGYGKSTGDPELSLLVHDVQAAIKLLRGRRIEHLVCIGASMGGTACLRAAFDTPLQGVVVMASQLTLGFPTSVMPKDLPKLTLPKLFICAEEDRYGTLPSITRQMYELSPEPKRIKLYSGKAHGTELFATAHGEDLTNLLVEFLTGIQQ